MANFEVINGENVRVNTTAQGKIYSKNYRPLVSELRAKGTAVTYNPEKHSFFISGNAYYAGGKSMENIKTLADIRKNASQVQFCDSITDTSLAMQQKANAERVANGEQPKPIEWVPCMFITTTGEHGDFSDLIK